MTSSKCNLRKNVLASYWKYSRQQGEEEDAAWHSLTSPVRSSDVVVRPNVFHLKLMRCNVPLCIHPASSFAHFPLASGPLWKLSLGEGLSTGKGTSQPVSQSVKTNTLHLFWLTCWGDCKSRIIYLEGSETRRKPDRSSLWRRSGF